jgi:hypothetical protein
VIKIGDLSMIEPNALTGAMTPTPLQELEALTGVRFYCVERYESREGARYFLLSFDGEHMSKFPVYSIRSAQHLNDWVPRARAIQGNTREYPPFTTKTARRVLALMHLVHESSPACNTITEGDRP